MLREFRAASRRSVITVVALLAAAVLAGCGIKGPLTLPPPAQAAATSAAPTPSTPPAERASDASPPSRTTP